MHPVRRVGKIVVSLFICLYVSVIDAMGKIPEGIADGKLHFVGSFDMCNNFVIENVSLPDSNKEINFNGQYCRLSIQPSVR